MLSKKSISNLKIDYLKNSPEHISKIAKWAFDAWGSYYPSSNTEVFHKWFSKTLRESNLPITFVALIDNELVGFYILQRSEFYSKQHLKPWLGGLLVKEKYQNNYIGTKLHNHAINFLKSLNYHQAFLIAFDNKLADWYENINWKIIKTENLFDNQAFIMSKFL